MLPAKIGNVVTFQSLIETTRKENNDFHDLLISLTTLAIVQFNLGKLCNLSPTSKISEVKVVWG